MQMLAALVRTSPWTTCMLWLERTKACCQDRAYSEPEPIIPLLSSTLSDSSCSSWGSPSCSCTHLSFLHFPFWEKETVSGTAFNSFPHLPFSLSLTYSPIASHNCTRSLFWPYSAHILMTNMWLLTEELPFCALGGNSRLHDGFLPSPKMPCWCFIITRSPPLWGALLSLINQQGDVLSTGRKIAWCSRKIRSST